MLLVQKWMHHPFAHEHQLGLSGWMNAVTHDSQHTRLKCMQSSDVMCTFKTMAQMDAGSPQVQLCFQATLLICPENVCV